MRRTRTNYAMLSILTSGLMIIMINLPPQQPEQTLSALLFASAVHIYLAIGRLKDMNANPWWSVLTLLPLVSFILMFPKGTKGANQYGEDPREKGNN
ncbi:DUF805 domain-containing protein [Glaesserella parasuis]|uniref:DUF805 domain-containing protein n=1 Tax=Glaesserella parasuis TaxID=738 RepID=A0AAJ6AJ84_GLAPU|nr:DUF805 domain-containing protein [Glaesserella parasuis]KEZ14720.1 putative membrane protein [Glaesserella parasuis]MCT8554021.1 DUF805 domain-containing protein [Glaesserella parasuis]MCT8574843.1 DUF805 domain-containing protein [Glaesserella parasuis]MCT8655805.1 DUF805 domain-containing protein [Glaesserella parasuis]MCT8757626.1 DUF805 domain-containing protein [Glaesserella parasuis]